MDDVLLEATENGLRTLSLNRPERRNALNPALSQALLDATTRAAHDPAVTAVLLRSEGGNFCVGGDVKAMAEGPTVAAGVEAKVGALRRRMETSRLLHTMHKPTVAAIRGAAAGAGLSLALACDFRVAGRSAKFNTAFATVGLSGDFGGTWFLTRLVGAGKARELYLRPRVVLADEALALGLLTEVVDDDAVDAVAQSLAKSLATGPTIALAYIKQNLLHAETASLESALDLEAAHHVRCGMTADHREAAAAFVEKRAPRFQGV